MQVQADRLMKSGRYAEAISIYELLLQSRSTQSDANNEFHLHLLDSLR